MATQRKERRGGMARGCAAAAVVAAAAAGCSGGGPSRAAVDTGGSPTSATTAVAAPALTSSPPSTVAVTSTAATTSSTVATTFATAPPTTRAVEQTLAATTKVTSPPTTACAGGVAASLSYTGSARQLVTVTAPSAASTTATVELWQKSGGCWTMVYGPWAAHIGSAGFSDHKREGDGTTPTGMYPLGPVMYGNQPDPGVREPYHHLVCGDWWDEDPSSATYNTFQHVACNTTPPFGGGSEALWTETAPYPSFAVIDYNTSPVVAGAGSGIFFHADTGGPTAGCVSVALANLDTALRWLDPAAAPAFVMGPAQEISRF